MRFLTINISNRPSLMVALISLVFHKILIGKQILLMLGIQNNPFHKANPFRLIQFDKFQHAHLPGQKAQDHQQNLYKEHLRVVPARPLENNWTFNDNNLDRRHDFSRKPELANSRASDFEMKMKMSNIGMGSKQPQRAPYVQDGRLENPFFRKNLLFNKEEVLNQVQLDVSLYRNKARSSYESVPTVTNIPQSTYIDSPALTRPRASISEYDSKQANLNPYGNQSSPSVNNSLGYSKTPELTQRVSGRVIQQPNQGQEKEFPATLTFKGKTFFLS